MIMIYERIIGRDIRTWPVLAVTIYFRYVGFIDTSNHYEVLARAIKILILSALIMNEQCLACCQQQVIYSIKMRYAINISLT